MWNSGWGPDLWGTQKGSLSPQCHKPLLTLSTSAQLAFYSSCSACVLALAVFPEQMFSRARTQRGWCGYVARRKVSRFFHVNSFELVTNVLLSLSSAYRFQISEQWTNLEQRGKSCQDTVSIHASSTVSCVSQIHNMNSNKFLFIPVIFRGSSREVLRYTSICRITRLLLVKKEKEKRRGWGAVNWDCQVCFHVSQDCPVCFYVSQGSEPLDSANIHIMPGLRPLPNFHWTVHDSVHLPIINQ